ncbi:hypothetical protein GR925_22840 [Streptomyces sp. HUCO-GS316]|uniref:ATP-binding protein n=1 Tax=Streptomyces sp. HUCO-GS316 TaxID=2692198 RepID=UPI00136F8A81|nr:ATP-binding protein [Streptomyces sp. HUCO-GS316]MXM66194.1 hypothetical protein [Streptomyces sp. HUCO-GS316]
MDAVIDDGCGVPPHDRQRVMDMFTRLHQDVEGSGIGLATCERIATAIDGRPLRRSGPRIRLRSVPTAQGAPLQLTR